MNPQQIEKLKVLIQSSPILSFVERAEWLALLELMNDKQLGELEKILSSNQGAADSRQQTAQQDTQLVTHNTQPGGRPMPPLSHIMNLPKNFGQGAAVKARPLVVPQVPPKANLPTQIKPPVVSSQSKTKSVFTERLKAIFSKKELSTSKPQYPLELPEGQRVVTSDELRVNSREPQMKPVATSMPQSALNSSKPKDLIVDKPKTLPEGPTVKFPEVLTQPPKIPSPVVLKPKPEAVPEMKPVNIEDLLAKVVTKPSAPVPTKPLLPKEKFTPGVNFTKTSEKTRSDTLENIKQHLEEKGGSVSELKPQNLKELSFKTPTELASFDANILDNNKLDNLVSKIKHLIGQFGYFEVIFNLEKSIVYKAYIATGLKLLTDQIDFAQLEANYKNQGFLDKIEFEKFTDLLAKIQAS